MVDAVFLDLDGTICDFTRSPETLLEATFDSLDVDPFFTADDYRDQMRAFSKPASDVRKRRRCFEKFAREAGYDPAVGREVAAAYERRRDYTRVEFRPGAADLLVRLEERYALGLITNGTPETQAPKIDSLDIRDHFETVVYAGHHTPPKPAPDCFERALDAVGVDPGDAVYVGDSLEHDVAGAKAAGVGSIYVTGGVWDEPEDAATPDHTVESLADVESVLG